MFATVDASQWDKRYAEVGLQWGVEPNRFLVREAAGLEPGSALDVASGEGRNAIWLAEAGWHVVGVDFSRVAIDKARRIAANRGVDVEWVVADVVDYVPSPQAFELVIIFYLHLRASDMQHVLSKAAAAVASSGTLLVVGHHRSNIAEGVGGPQDPTVLIDPDDVAGHLEGLVIEKAEAVLRPVEGADRDAIDALVRARRP